ncbi:MAG: matrixin family metalloprotease [Acidobacteriia bacterium]|nr:matrixin family metalloprotease [Terriglobia bacterium]
MATRKTAVRKTAAHAAARRAHTFCAVPRLPERPLSSRTEPARLELIRVNETKWANGTVLKYHFFRGPAKWTATEARKQMVRDAFARWKALGIGLEFNEVDTPAAADIRIGFEANDGHWSYVGREVRGIAVSRRTMNLDKADAYDIDTPLHEIGHTLGFPHEHQNPNAGIVWNEEAVYAALAEPPNSWSRDKTFDNIISKIKPDTVQGSSWDPDSVMHYPFEAGLIVEPVRYSAGLTPAGGLSPRDVEWVKTFYPPLTASDYTKLKAFESVRLRLEPSQQVNFIVEPEASREYTLQTFGDSDAVLVLFEDTGGEPRFLAGDDDSGVDRNASIKIRLFADRKYILRLRLYFQNRAGDLSVMMW